jgi:hypothetical protein
MRENPMAKVFNLALISLSLLLTGCVTQEVKNKALLAKFLDDAAGTWISDSGAQLTIMPVRARMVTDDALYVERVARDGTVFGRLVNVVISADGKKVNQRALTFTQEGQWRNLRETPELFTALLPKDVKPAGTCDIHPAPDANTVSYSCGGSPPEVFTRQ